MLSLEEKENIYTYNMPSFNGTLKLLLNEVEKSFQIITNEDDFKNNQNNINLYALVSTLNTVLGFLFMNNQEFLLKKFNEKEIDKYFPCDEEFQQEQSIQKLALNYPLLNSEIAIRLYQPLFIEKEVEGKFISDNNTIEQECFIPIVQYQIINSLDFILYFERILKSNLTYFNNKDNYHYFINIFLQFLSIKYELLINIEQYRNICKICYNDKIKEKYEKVKKSFSFDENIIDYIPKILNNYMENDKKNNKNNDYPNLLPNIFDLLMKILIFRINEKTISNDINTFNDDIVILKIIFNVVLAMQNCIANSYYQDNNAEMFFKASIAYHRPYIKYASLMGAYLQSNEKHEEVLKGIYSNRMRKLSYEIQILYNRLKEIMREQQLILFEQDIAIIENELKVRNSVKTYIAFLEEFLKEVKNGDTNAK